MIRLRILKFALLSTAVHLAALPSWTTPTLPKLSASAALSVGFAAVTPATASAKSTAKSTTSKARVKRARPSPDKEQVRKQQEPTPVKAAKRQPPKPSQTRTRRPPATIRMETIRKMQTPATQLTAAAVRTVHRSAVEVASADKPSKGSVQASRNSVKLGAPLAARPWESVWGSMRYYQPRERQFTALRSPLPSRNPVAPPTVTEGQAPPEASAIGGKNASQVAQALIRGRLRTDLARYFYYPVIARRHGWQGRVRVAFTVQPDGRLTDLRVTHSSGYRVLDQSALKALRKVGNLAEAREWLKGQSAQIELPVIYRLED
ncbi:MAG: energy transducer TonB [Acidiferrobacterales bacterium]